MTIAFGKSVLILLTILAFPASAMMDDFQKIDPKAEKILSNINWDQATTIEVNLQDHDFTPSDLVFIHGKPYILRLKNLGTQAHDMVGGSFFQAIVVKMVNSPSGRVVTPYLKSVHVRSKKEIEIWFVPTRTGQFGFHCSLPGHREAGMEGVVVIR